MKGIVLTTLTEICTVEIHDNGLPLYKLARDIVGGHIETVYPRRLDPLFALIVNEEGLLKNLPINPVASWLYGADTHGHPITGDALILKIGLFNGEPDVIGIPDNEIKACMRKLLRSVPKNFINVKGNVKNV